MCGQIIFDKGAKKENLVVLAQFIEESVILIWKKKINFSTTSQKLN